MLRFSLKTISLLLVGGTTAWVLSSPLAAAQSEEDNNCLGFKLAFECSVRESNDLRDPSAARPAFLSYTVNDQKGDSYAVKAAFRAGWDVSKPFREFADVTTFEVGTQWHKTNQQTKEQDNFKVGGGLKFDHLVGDQAKGKGGWTLYSDVNVAYNRKAKFGDKDNAACVAIPDQQACQKQYLDSLRSSIDFAPFSRDYFEIRPQENKLYAVFSPTFGVFWDEALNDGVELLDGNIADGSVIGAYANGVIAVSPSFLDYKWQASVSGQIIEAFEQGQFRKDDFKKTSRLFTASLDYALGNNYKNPDAKAWFPVIGISYSKGRDALNGRDPQEITEVGFKLKY